MNTFDMLNALSNGFVPISMTLTNSKVTLTSKKYTYRFNVLCESLFDVGHVSRCMLFSNIVDE